MWDNGGASSHIPKTLAVYGSVGV